MDDAVVEDTEFLVVKFGSNAYFELVQEVARLRPIFAAGKFVVVKMTETHAVLISDRTGIEDFSADDRKQIGLAAD